VSCRARVSGGWRNTLTLRRSAMRSVYNSNPSCNAALVGSMEKRIRRECAAVRRVEHPGHGKPRGGREQKDNDETCRVSNNGLLRDCVRTLSHPLLHATSLSLPAAGCYGLPKQPSHRTV